MKVTLDTLFLEYRQEKFDEDYGTCPWARYVVHLAQPELDIISDRGNYICAWKNISIKDFPDFLLNCSKENLVSQICRYFDVICDSDISNIWKVASIFDEYIKPKLKKILYNNKE